MRKLPLIFLIVAFLGVLLVAGCGRDDSLTGALSEKASGITPAAPYNEDVVIGGYHIHFDGRTYMDGETTFRWTVSGTGQNEDDLDWFFIELPECAPEPVSWDPEEPVRFYTNPQYDITGMKWMLPMDSGDEQGRQYSVTFPGDVPEGQIRSLINAGQPTHLGKTAGPCGGFEISGMAFIDANFDGIFDPGMDTGLGNVEVELEDEQGGVMTTFTDALGNYSFVAPAGMYTAHVDTSAAAGGFNPELGRSFLPTTALDLDVIVGPDLTGVDFGFYVNFEDVVSGIEDGSIPTAGEGGTWWKLQLRVAIQLERLFDDPPVFKRWYGPVRMHEFLDTIETLHLEEPFQFADARELQDAYDLLRIPYGHNTIEELLHVLLLSELNFVAGKGIEGEEQLTDALIAWGEGVALDILNGDDLGKATQDIGGVIRVFRGLNTGGGGDIDD